MKRIIATAMLGAVVLSFSAPARATAMADASPKESMFYVVMAHPDDEMWAWSMVDEHSDDYVVMVTMTQGEGTSSCMDEATARSKMGSLSPEGQVVEDLWAAEGFGTNGDYRRGPFKYQGPGSPVNEPDKGERHPLGDPWEGQWTDGCKEARIASWHWFLDDMNALDGTTTSFEVAEDPYIDDDYQGSFCPPGQPGRPHNGKLPCADVWADGEGARVAFDFGNAAPGTYDGGAFPAATFDRDDVTAALQSLRTNRAEWGLPELAEVGMVNGAAYYDGDTPGCPYYDNQDHRVVQEAIRYVDQGAGPQYGGTICPTDPFAEGADRHIAPQNWANIILTNWVEPTEERRIGPFVKNYGWLFSTYTFANSADIYWKVFD